MSDQVWLKLIENIPLTVTAVSGTIIAINTWKAKQHAASASQKGTEIREGQIEIKAQTDGQLTAALAEAKQWRELAQALLAIQSAREGRPITAVSQVVRSTDGLVKRGNGGVQKERRVTDLKIDHPDEEPDEAS